MSSKAGIGFLTVLGLGLAGGWVVARMTYESRVEEVEAGPTIGSAQPGQIGPAAPVLETPDRAPAAGRPVRENRVEAPAIGEAPAVGLISPALERHARSGIVRGWKSSRDDDIPATQLEEGYAQFRQMVVDAPEGIGRRLASIQNELDAATLEGPAFLLLSKLEEGVAGDDADILYDPAAYAELFEFDSQPSARNGVAHLEDAGVALQDGTTLQFPAGVFRPKKLMTRSFAFPRDVTIRGAGMDATLLILKDLRNDAAVKNLAVRDCTVYTESAPFFDLRRQPSTVYLENVRFIGFDSGAGGSSLFYSPAGAFLARNCRFEGGYGRRPGLANLFDIRSPAHLARFEGCTLSLVSKPWSHLRGTLVFENCTLEDLLTWGPPRKDVPTGVTLSNSSVTYRDYSKDKVEPRDLNTLFPDWEAHVNR